MEKQVNESELLKIAGAVEEFNNANVQPEPINITPGIIIAALKSVQNAIKDTNEHWGEIVREFEDKNEAISVIDDVIYILDRMDNNAPALFGNEE